MGASPAGRRPELGEEVRGEPGRKKEERPGRTLPADHRPPTPAPCSRPGREPREAPAEPPAASRAARGRPRSRTNNVRLGGTKAAGLGLLNTSEARRAARFIGLGEPRPRLRVQSLPPPRPAPSPALPTGEKPLAWGARPSPRSVLPQLRGVPVTPAHWNSRNSCNPNIW
ncbi:MAP7 domain-containing protein 1-like isoform X2 [Myiozetetes cayanensis]|uniref:MAP7 domain-containing protein 1-like isoform X2 n=1 Tax=Myiozetetes cayanensis TaxID=478635 RepID=UPI00215E8067|nr:MAP7 domain-containing protein 1-like isoform X2 [Myiozetetes cayanensis]